MNLKKYRIKVQVRGKTQNGILMNPMTEEMLDKLHSRSTGPARTDISPREVAESKLIRDPETGRLAIPSQYLYSCLVEAGRRVDLRARQKVSTLDTTELFSFFALEGGEFIPLNNGVTDEEPAWVVDKRRGVNYNAGRGKGGGVPVCTIRPKLPRWGFTVMCEVEGWNVPSLDVVRKLFIRAGQVGIGDFRPSCRGPFGQFELVSFKVEETIEMSSEDVFVDTAEENGGEGAEAESELVGTGAAAA